MEPRHFYRTCDAKQALLCVRDLEELSILVDMGVVVLLERQCPYRLVRLRRHESTSADEAALIETILSQRVSGAVRCARFRWLAAL